MKGTLEDGWIKGRGMRLAAWTCGIYGIRIVFSVASFVREFGICGCRVGRRKGLLGLSSRATIAWLRAKLAFSLIATRSFTYEQAGSS